MNLDKIKNWSLLIGFVLIVGLSIALYISIRNCNQVGDANKAQAAVVNTAAKLVKSFADTLGNYHKQYEAQNPVAANSVSTQKLPGWVDTAGKGLDAGANYKQKLLEATQVTLALKDSLLQAQVKLNSAKQQVFFYKNKYLNLSYTAGRGIDTNDHGTFAYRYNANLTVSKFYKQSWFLGSKKMIIDVAAEDSNMTVNNLKHYEVQIPDPLFSFRLQALGSYNFSTKSIVPGIGMQMNSGKYSITGGYYYRFGSTKPFFTVGGRFDILKF